MRLSAIPILLLLSPFLLRAQYLNIQVNRPGGLNPDPEEVTIAINPADSLNLVAGANLRSVYYSFDGGKSWAEDTLARDTYGDPSVIFDADGRAFYGHLSPRFEAIYVRRSTDGGRSWSIPAKLRGPNSDSAKPGALYRSSLQDKEWLAADMTGSPWRGNIYAAWTDFSKYGSASPNDSSVIVFARSTDHGSSFLPYVRVSDEKGDAVDSDNTMEGAVPAVGPGGEVYIAWAGPKGLYFDRSLDGGATFGADKLLAATPGGWDISVAGIYRCNGLPVTGADISASPHRGTVYVNWVDVRNGDPDVFLMTSTDRGATWSAPKRVNDDSIGNGKDQFFTWMSVDPVTGDISIVFYDRRRYAGDSTDVYLARSTDGGESFVNSRISDAAFYPTASIFFGDYAGIAAYAGRIRPVWMELTGGVLSVHTALVDPSGTAAPAERSPRGFFLSQNYPNPFSRGRTGGALSATTIPFGVGARSRVRLSIVDLLGREVLLLAEGEYAPGSYTSVLRGDRLAPGAYACRLEAGGRVWARLLTCLR